MPFWPDGYLADVGLRAAYLALARILIVMREEPLLALLLDSILFFVFCFLSYISVVGPVPVAVSLLHPISIVPT